MGNESRTPEVSRYEKPLVEVFDAADLLEALGTAACISVRGGQPT